MNGGCPAPLMNALQVVAIIGLTVGSYLVRWYLRRLSSDLAETRDRNVAGLPRYRDYPAPSLAERLAALDDLRDREEIGPDEYTERRQRILAEAAGRPR